MPIRVTFRVKRGSSLPIHERAKKQRMTNVPRIHVKSEIVTTVEEVTVKTEEIDDGSTGALVQERIPKAKKQWTTQMPRIRIKSETVNTTEEVTVKSEEVDVNTPAGNHGASNSALCEPSYDPHLSHSASAIVLLLRSKAHHK